MANDLDAVALVKWFRETHPETAKATDALLDQIARLTAEVEKLRERLNGQG